MKHQTSIFDEVQPCAKSVGIEYNVLKKCHEGPEGIKVMDLAALRSRWAIEHGLQGTPEVWLTAKI